MQSQKVMESLINQGKDKGKAIVIGGATALKRASKNPALTVDVKLYGDDGVTEWATLKVNNINNNGKGNYTGKVSTVELEFTASGGKFTFKAKKGDVTHEHIQTPGQIAFEDLLLKNKNNRLNGTLTGFNYKQVLAAIEEKGSTLKVLATDVLNNKYDIVLSHIEKNGEESFTAISGNSHIYVLVGDEDSFTFEAGLLLPAELIKDLRANNGILEGTVDVLIGEMDSNINNGNLSIEADLKVEGKTYPKVNLTGLMKNKRNIFTTIGTTMFTFGEEGGDVTFVTGNTQTVVHQVLVNKTEEVGVEVA